MNAPTETNSEPTLRDKFLLLAHNNAGLKAVERLIQTKFESEAKLLNEIPSYLLSLGGKRIRPLLCLICARALGMSSPNQALLEVSAGIELIHMATLLHDDIIDKSPVRRHKQSAFLKFGIPNTLLAGDFLLVRAFSLCAKLDKFIIEATEKACIELTEGEIEELPLSQAILTPEQVLEIARKKTAALFRLSCESAAFIATGNTALVERFARFGENLGVAFQILDDILDVVSDEETLGKKAGQDIREQKPSIVNALWIRSGSPTSKKLAQAGATDSDHYVATAIQELKESGIIHEARTLALQFVTRAREAISTPLPKNNPANLKELETILDYTVSRLE